MKKIVFLGTIMILFVSCDTEELYKKSPDRTDTYYPYKAACCKVSLSYNYSQAQYTKNMNIFFSDTCSENVSALIYLNGKLLCDRNTTEWSLDIDSTQMSLGKSDSLLLDITYSGLSKRYGWYYNRRVLRKIWYHFSRGESYTSSFTRDNCTPYANMYLFDFFNDGDSIHYDTDYQLFQLTTGAYACPGHDEILFISSGGNQLHLRANWPDNEEFDEITLWYGEYILDTIYDRGWEKRYYLDEFPQDGSFYIQIVKDSVKKTIPFQVYTDYGF